LPSFIRANRRRDVDAVKPKFGGQRLLVCGATREPRYCSLAARSRGLAGQFDGDQTEKALALLR
jgi:hypothetical protein